MKRDPNKVREIWLIENTCYQPTFGMEPWYLSVQVTHDLVEKILDAYDLSIQNTKRLKTSSGITMQTQSAIGISDFHAHDDMAERDYNTMVKHFEPCMDPDKKYVRIKKPGKWHKGMECEAEAEDCELTVSADLSPENLAKDGGQLVHIEFALNTYEDQTYYFYFKIPLEELLNIRH